MQADYKIEKANILIITNLGVASERVYVRDIERVWVSPLMSRHTYDIYFRVTENNEESDDARTLIETYEKHVHVVRIGNIRECLDSFNEIKQMMKDEYKHK